MGYPKSPLIPRGRSGVISVETESPTREGLLLAPDTQVDGCFSPEWVEKPPFPQKWFLTGPKGV